MGRVAPKKLSIDRTGPILGPNFCAQILLVQTKIGPGQKKIDQKVIFDLPKNKKKLERTRPRAKKFYPNSSKIRTESG